MSGRWFSASWLGSVPTAAAMELGDPFEAKTWFSARQHACAVLGLDVGQVEVVEVEEGAESRDIVVEAVRERTVLMRYAPINARWICDDHPLATGTPYANIMECSVCGRAMWTLKEEEDQTSGVRLKVVEEDEMDPAGVGEGESR